MYLCILLLSVKEKNDLNFEFDKKAKVPFLFSSASYKLEKPRVALAPESAETTVTETFLYKPGGKADTIDRACDLTYETSDMRVASRPPRSPNLLLCALTKLG